MTSPIGVRVRADLPEDVGSVQVARALVGAACDAIGVAPTCRREIELALSEACSNAVRHARAGRQFRITVEVAGDRCVVEVIDSGVGFDPDTSGFRPPAEQESGRGLLILAVVTDDLEIRSLPGRGTTVRFTKILIFDPVPVAANDH